MSQIVALGAEAQAASSLALANPEHKVLFVSDQPVLDGWDLPNVRFHHANPRTWQSLVGPDDLVMPLCPRWLPDQDWSLSRTLPRAAQAVGEALVLPVRDHPRATGDWQLKGRAWHRPDAPMAGPAADLAETTDPHGCGLVYQPQIGTEGTAMTIGRRHRGLVAFGLFRVFEERFFRYVVMQAAESIADERIATLSLAILDGLALDGFFTLNWVLTSDGPRLTSIRPVPRAVFGAFRRGGIDVLGPLTGNVVLRPGLRLVAQPHYASYRRLEA